MSILSRRTTPPWQAQQFMNSFLEAVLVMTAVGGKASTARDETILSTVNRPNEGHPFYSARLASRPFQMCKELKVEVSNLS
jgi:hypothetical protein